MCCEGELVLEDSLCSLDNAAADGKPLGERLSSQRTVVIFDWDDTLLASTFLAMNDCNVDDGMEVPDQFAIELEVLEHLAIGCLEEAMQLGNVTIITNAELGWVEMSAGKFMPNLLNVITCNNISVVSARSMYELLFPEAPSKWKSQAFEVELDELFPGTDGLNVVVLGDSQSERDAAHIVAAKLPLSFVKTVKLVERPSIEQLQRQMSLLRTSLQDICDHEGSFDVDLLCS